MNNDVANGCGIAVGFFILASAVIAFTAWIVMLFAGAIASKHGWYSVGFSETVLWLGLIATIGGVFNTGLLGTRGK